jgi:hypothetical protein
VEVLSERIHAESRAGGVGLAAHDMTVMRRGTGGHVRSLAVIGAMVLCPGSWGVSAQTASEPALKSAFLYNFPRFTEWPPEVLAPGDPILLCVVNDGVVAGMLETLTKGRNVEGHPLVVSTMAQDSPAPALSVCSVVFLSGLGLVRSAALLEALNGKPILTVGDGEAFARAGGIVGLFIKDGTLQFGINTTAAQRAGLRLSSKLLNLAKPVKEDRNATRR